MPGSAPVRSSPADRPHPVAAACACWSSPRVRDRPTPGSSSCCRQFPGLVDEQQRSHSGNVEMAPRTDYRGTGSCALPSERGGQILSFPAVGEACKPYPVPGTGRCSASFRGTATATTRAGHAARASNRAILRTACCRKRAYGLSGGAVWAPSSGIVSFVTAHSGGAGAAPSSLRRVGNGFTQTAGSRCLARASCFPTGAGSRRRAPFGCRAGPSRSRSARNSRRPTLFNPSRNRLVPSIRWIIASVHSIFEVSGFATVKQPQAPARGDLAD